MKIIDEKLHQNGNFLRLWPKNGNGVGSSEVLRMCGSINKFWAPIMQWVLICKTFCLAFVTFLILQSIFNLTINLNVNLINNDYSVI